MAVIRKRVDSKQRVTWQVQIRRAGWPPVSATFAKKEQAKRWADDVERDMDAGVHSDPKKPLSETLNDLIDRYLREVTDKRPGEASRRSERARLERFQREETALCRTAAGNLRAAHFEAYRDRRLKQHASRGGGPWKPAVPKRFRKDGTPIQAPKKPPQPPTLISSSAVKRELTILEGVIEHSRRRLGLRYNPVNRKDVKRPAVNDERLVRLEPDKIRKLLAECYAARNPWVGPLVEFAFEVGPRRGNLLRLRRSDINLKSRSALLRAVKNSRSPDKIIDVAVALSPRAVEILAEVAWSIDRRDDRVFPITGSTLAQAFDHARRRAGFEHFRLHDARHERAASLIEAGWSDIEVMSQTGHRDPKSLKRYANLRPSHLAEKLAALPRR